MVGHRDYNEEAYSERQESKNYCVIYEQNQWDGFSSDLDFLEFMHDKGWEFIHSDKNVDPHSEECLAKRTFIELVFKRIK